MDSPNNKSPHPLFGDRVSSPVAGSGYSSNVHVPAGMYEQEIQSRLEEWEGKYNNTSTTSKMLETLRETHSSGVDTLMKLGTQSEQLNNIAKMTAEQEEQIKGLGKYKKFQKYMVRGRNKQSKEKKEHKPKEIHHEVNYVKSRHDANTKIYKKREDDKMRENGLEVNGGKSPTNGGGEMEKRFDYYNDNETNPFSQNNKSSTGTTPTMSKRNKEEEIDEEGGGLSKRMWSRYGSSAEQAMAEKKDITKVTEYDVQDNEFIKQATWIKQEDAHLEEMGYILEDLKNIAVATHSEVKAQGVRMDEIGDSMDRGSDFNLKKKNPKKVAKEKKKAEKEEAKRKKLEEKNKKDLERNVSSSLGSDHKGKPLYTSKYDDNGKDISLKKDQKSKDKGGGNPFL